MAQRLIEEYLAVAGHGADAAGPGSSDEQPHREIDAFAWLAKAAAQGICQLL
ncbi:MAG: hypothetical protein ACLQU2_23470 [Candidatus Binataceae bacterium]